MIDTAARLSRKTGSAGDLHLAEGCIDAVGFKLLKSATREGIGEVSHGHGVRCAMNVSSRGWRRSARAS